MIDKRLLDVLACPMCKDSELSEEIIKTDSDRSGEGILHCSTCKRTYTIMRGIPVMMPDALDADLSVKDKTWELWREKMDNTVVFLKRMWNGSKRAKRIEVKKNQMLEEFFHFCNFSGQKILDIGCRTGEVKRFLNGKEYFGIDPLMPNNEVSFLFIQGVGEYLPFRASQFDGAMLILSFDHVLYPEIVIQEVARVLKEYGEIFIVQIDDTLMDKKYSFRGFLKGNSTFYQFLYFSYIEPLKEKLGFIVGDSTHIKLFTTKDIVNLLMPYFEDIKTSSYEYVAFFKARKAKQVKIS